MVERLSAVSIKPVVICSKDEAERHLPELCGKAGFNIEDCRLALVKPNVCGLYHPSLDLLQAVIQYLGIFAEKIAVVESKSMIHNPARQFKRLGIDGLVRQFGDRARTVDLSDESTVKVKVPHPHVLEQLELPEIVLESDVLVNVPKVGTHSATRITNALKNLFGLLPQERKQSLYHPLGMSEVIADIAQVIKSDLNVTDAAEKVIVGTDPLAVDIASCRFVDIDPLKVKHLRLVSEDRGEQLEDLMKDVKVADY